MLWTLKSEMWVVVSLKWCLIPLSDEIPTDHPSDTHLSLWHPSFSTFHPIWKFWKQIPARQAMNREVASRFWNPLKVTSPYYPHVIPIVIPNCYLWPHIKYIFLQATSLRFGSSTSSRCGFWSWKTRGKIEPSSAPWSTAPTFGSAL